MGETLYGVLGVTEDAPPEAIRSAYRERVKESHPDVADEPTAARTFKRLTAARDVLVDETERARYDRVGHDAYVRQHLGSDLWGVEGSAASAAAGSPADVRTEPRSAAADGAGGTATAGTARQRRSARDASDRSSWVGQDPGEYGERRRPRGRRAGVSEDWQVASEVYRTTPRSAHPTGGESALERAGRILRTIGPWLLVHVAFVASAIATGWFTFAQPDGVIQPTPPALVIGAVLFLLVVGLSTLHVVSLLYS